MTRNCAKIKAGIAALADRPYEILSGTVVSRSISADQLTITVQPSGGGSAIQGVMLNAITGDNNGLILFPKDGTNVVIASVDGPGEWCLVRASEINKAIVTIGNVVLELDDSQISIKNSEVEFNISDSVFKMSTASESMFTLLKDCFTYITQLTVPTPSGASGVPTNLADFTNLITRLNNLLS